MAKAEFNNIRLELDKIMAPYATKLDSKIDEDGNLHVDTKYIRENGKPLYFGSVIARKHSVAFHLMPVYVNPALLDSASPELKKLMRGKSCFHFTSGTMNLLSELKSLTKSGFEDYKEKGYV